MAVFFTLLRILFFGLPILFGTRQFYQLDRALKILFFIKQKQLFFLLKIEKKAVFVLL